METSILDDPKQLWRDLCNAESGVSRRAPESSSQVQVLREVIANRNEALAFYESQHVADEQAKKVLSGRVLFWKLATLITSLIAIVTILLRWRVSL